MRSYLEICGLNKGAQNGSFENWNGIIQGKDICIQLCVSEHEIPTFTIETIIRDTKDSLKKFRSIVSVIR